ncbi:molybdate ABC transporter substrate-binding protein [Paenibacillus woosongensis]|uniref:Molybdate ABC transporter substrate-binding protein n=1 Tax=Paenibacillus woosongensis TaxID=307580 RepID=A0ABQ4MVZ5_9BACL|nr:molybdate ABC transporter substrate-binding protein [Paenibacillus woosongensis]GIP60097.1 molybdate ABC transporter substrate-binding protein [Paenibacillus woosongensis]
MRSLRIFPVLFLFISLVFTGCSTASDEQVELTISAAASLTDAMKEIQASYEAQHPAVKLTFNFGGSGALQKQIEQGAPVDLFLSAAANNMNLLLDQNIIDAKQHMNLLTNKLVVVIPDDQSDEIQGLEDLKDTRIKMIAVGIPESVPAGSYAREALMSAGLWDILQPKMVQAKDVRQVLQYVETGNADAGFVYESDALTSAKVKIALPVDPAIYTPVEYPIGVIKSTKHGKEAAELYNYLQSKEALDVFVKYGFTPAQSL